jgi:hypothetical protein
MSHNCLFYIREKACKGERKNEKYVEKLYTGKEIKK